jgi:zinc transport system permease protein
MTEPFMLRAMLAGLALALVAAPLGCFVVWRRMAYFGETIAQGGIIGVALSLALSINTSLTVLGVAILLALLLLGLSRQQVIPLDSLLGVLAHAALAVGIVGASQVSGRKIDLLAFLFGDIYSVTREDLQWIFACGSLALVALFWIWKPLLSLSVHEELAGAEGVPVERTKAVFVLILAIVVAVALKVVGALLTIAFLIMPAAAARPFSETPEQMAFFATIFATLAVAFGLFVSVSIDAPGGPSIVLVLSVMFALAMLPLALGRRGGS